MYNPDFFTILSIRIEKWMQIPVEIATISQTEEEKLNSTIRIPKSCYNTDTNMIFYLAEQEGVFGTKFLAFSKAVDPLSITTDSILLPEEKDEKGQLLQIIKWSTYPLKDGDEVTIDQEGENKKQSGENRRILEKQKSFFFLFGITVLILIFIFAFGIKDLYKFPAGDYRKCVRGMLLILIGFGILWKITALVNIPREYLPPECILDLGLFTLIYKTDKVKLLYEKVLNRNSSLTFFFLSYQYFFSFKCKTIMMNLFFF